MDTATSSRQIIITVLFSILSSLCFNVYGGWCPVKYAAQCCPIAVSSDTTRFVEAEALVDAIGLSDQEAPGQSAEFIVSNNTERDLSYSIL